MNKGRKYGGRNIFGWWKISGERLGWSDSANWWVLICEFDVFDLDYVGHSSVSYLLATVTFETARSTGQLHAARLHAMRHHHFFDRIQVQSGCLLALLRLGFSLIYHHISRCIVGLLLMARGCFCLSSVLLCRNKFWESIDGNLGFLGAKSCFMTIYAILSRFSSFF